MPPAVNAAHRRHVVSVGGRKFGRTALNAALALQAQAPPAQVSAQVLSHPSPEVLYEQHLGLVESTVKGFLARRRISSMERDDLLQEGRLALYGAAQKFDSSRGSFETFATCSIQGAIRNALRDAGEPDLESTCSLAPCHLEALVEPSHDSAAEARVTLDQLLQQLTDRERLAVEMFHLQGHTKATIAGELGISERHAGRIIERAMQWLQVLAQESSSTSSSVNAR